MQVLVKLSTTLRDAVVGYDPMQGLLVTLPERADIATLLVHLGIPPEQVTITMINGKHAHKEDSLQPGDRVALFPAVGGG